MRNLIDPDKTFPQPDGKDQRQNRKSHVRAFRGARGPRPPCLTGAAVSAGGASVIDMLCIEVSFKLSEMRRACALKSGEVRHSSLRGHGTSTLRSSATRPGRAAITTTRVDR